MPSNKAGHSFIKHNIDQIFCTLFLCRFSMCKRNETIYQCNYCFLKLLQSKWNFTMFLRIVRQNSRGKFSGICQQIKGLLSAGIYARAGEVCCYPTLFSAESWKLMLATIPHSAECAMGFNLGPGAGGAEDCIQDPQEGKEQLCSLTSFTSQLHSELPRKVHSKALTGVYNCCL